MSVYEYASDMNKSVNEILDLCKKLDIKVNCSDDELSDDDIILLDNEIENNEADNLSNSELEEDNFEELEDDYSEEIDDIKVVSVNKKKKKNLKKEEKNGNDEFAKQKKEMYKHKDK